MVDLGVRYHLMIGIFFVIFCQTFSVSMTLSVLYIPLAPVFFVAFLHFDSILPLFLLILGLNMVINLFADVKIMN